MRIITPTGTFPDEAVSAAARALKLRPVDGVEPNYAADELVFEDDRGELRVSYFLDPTLEIPVLAIEGLAAGSVKQELEQVLPHVPELAAGIGFHADAPEGVKVTLLRLLAAHSMEMVTPPMARVAQLAAIDPSPFVRMGAVLLLQHAFNEEVAEPVRRHLLEDAVPEVRAFAREELARFDAAPEPAP